MSKFALAPILIVATIIIYPLFPIYAADTNSVGNTRTLLPAEVKGDTTQQRLDDLKAKIASREAALRVRLAAFKDQQKATLAQRISDTLNKINQNRTAEM